MKRLTVILMVVVLLLSFTLTAFAHPPAPAQSIGVANENAKEGLHRAAGRVMPDSVASHVLFVRVSPHYAD